MVGSTRSADFPTTAGAFDTTANGEFDAFVTRLNAAGSALVYSTFLGGAGFDSASGLTVDASGSAYVAGGAGSLDFPTTPGAFDVTPDGSDAFLSRLNPAGSALIFSTVLGGSASDGASAVRVDADGNSWLTGGTSSFDFPVTGDAADATFNGVADAFISSLSAGGSTLRLLDVSRRNPVGDRRRPRARLDRRRLHRRPHVFGRFPDDVRRLRHRLQRRLDDLLGRCVRHQAGRGCERLDAAVHSAGAACALAPGALQQRRSSAADHVRLERGRRRSVLHHPD